MKEYSERFINTLLKNINKEKQQIEIVVQKYENEGIDEYGHDFKSVYLKHLKDKLEFINETKEEDLVIGKQNIEEMFKDNEIRHLFLNTLRNYKFARIFEFSCGQPNKVFVCNKKDIEMFIEEIENVMII